MIDVGALRALCSVAGLGTIARAAQHLDFTPSAVSQQIKRLEHQVGVPLLATAGRGVVLTPAGQALVSAAADVFESLERGAEAARSAAYGRPAGVLRISAFSTAIRGLLAPRLPALMARCPDLRLAITEQDPEQAVHAVATGAAEMAIVHDADGLPPRIPASLTQRHIHTDVGDLVMHRAHPLAAERTVSSSDLAGQAWATSPPGTVCHQWFQRLLADQPGQPDVRHRIDDFATQLSLVAAGDVIALIPRLARPHLGDSLVARPVDPPPMRQISAVWRRSADASPAIRAVVTELTPDQAQKHHIPHPSETCTAPGVTPGAV
jgi:DNA-binding transcriptional LysR family regulator